MKIAIPSSGRPASVFPATFLYSEDYNVYVPENEYRSYSICGVNNLVSVPMEYSGITKTRNWVLNNTPDEEDFVFFMDDDVKSFHLMSHTQSKDVSTVGENIVVEIQRLFEFAFELGYPVFGIPEKHPKKTPRPPLIFSGYVSGSCMGVLKNTIIFDENYAFKEDYEISLRSQKEYGGILLGSYIGFSYDRKSSPNTMGGCVNYRNEEDVKLCVDMLFDGYPGHVIKSYKDGDPNYIDVI